MADIVFSRDADDNVVITLGSDSVAILAAAYAEGRYSIHYGSGDTALGKLSLGTTGDDPLLTGTDGADLLLGLGGVDILRGGDGADTLDGGAGNDDLYGGAGKDTLDGGEGTDIAEYYSSSKGVRVSLLLQGQAQQDFEANTFGFVANNNEAVGDILSSIENLRGSDHNDWLTGDGADNEIRGGTGEDILDGGAGNDYLSGGAGKDYLEGGEGADMLDGGVGVYASDTAGYNFSSKGVRVDLARTDAQIDFDGTHGFVANNNEAVVTSSSTSKG